MIVEIRAFRRYKDTPLDEQPVICEAYWPRAETEAYWPRAETLTLCEISYFPTTVWE